MNINELRDVLAKNYAALGFELKNLELMRSNDWPGTVLRGMIRCPCGGHEYFNLTLGVLPPDINMLAAEILRNTASKQHLERDVAEGKLPPFDIEKHVFKELVA